MMENVYVLKSSENKNMVKIGTTKDLDARLKQFEQTAKHLGKNVEYEYLATYQVEDGRKLENHLHRHFNADRKLGEWFTTDLKEIKKYVNSLDMSQFKREKSCEFIEPKDIYVFPKEDNLYRFLLTEHDEATIKEWKEMGNEIAQQEEFVVYNKQLFDYVLYGKNNLGSWTVDWMVKDIRSKVFHEIEFMTNETTEGLEGEWFMSFDIEECYEKLEKEIGKLKARNFILESFVNPLAQLESVDKMVYKDLAKLLMKMDFYDSEEVSGLSCKYGWSLKAHTHIRYFVEQECQTQVDKYNKALNGSIVYETYQDIIDYFNAVKIYSDNRNNKFVPLFYNNLYNL